MNTTEIQPMTSATSMRTPTFRPWAVNVNIASQAECVLPNGTTNECMGAVSPYRALWLETMEMLSASAGNECRLLTRNLPFEHAAHASKNGRFKIQAKAWILLQSGQPITEFRVVLIEGSANTILNTWAFPFASCPLPVFAAELIALANLPRLTFMDIQVPGLNELQIHAVRELTAGIRDAFDDLVSDEVPPSWAIDATAGDFLFLRSAEADVFPRIQLGYLSLLEAYLALTRTHFKSKYDRTCARQRTDALRDYQHHHMQHSPGRVFLGKVFGEHWTDDFLNNFLFTLPGV